MVIVALVVSIAASAAAQARCADDLSALQAKVDHDQKRNPTPQSAAAAKELKKAADNIKNMDEVDCYNAVARAQRALRAPAPTLEARP
jgi:hypothetical protein